MDMYIFLQALITGILVGAVYGLVALGWVIIYKCSGVLNLAMGEMTLIGGFVCLSLYTAFFGWMPESVHLNFGFFTLEAKHVAFLLAGLGTLVVGMILGLVTERLFLRQMIGEPILAVIMVTVGLAFFFKGMAQLVWDTGMAAFKPPVFSSEPIRLGEKVVKGVPHAVAIDQIYLWAFVACIVLMVIFILFFKYTRWGLSMQACADDEMAALSLGVSAKFVYALAWGIAFMSAAVGGTILGNLTGLNLSVSYLGLLVLPAIVFGGLNSIPGAIVGGITIGLLENFAGVYLNEFLNWAIPALSPWNVKKIAPFVFMVIFLLFKPFGLWGWERIERV